MITLSLKAKGRNVSKRREGANVRNLLGCLRLHWTIPICTRRPGVIVTHTPFPFKYVPTWIAHLRLILLVGQV